MLEGVKVLELASFYPAPFCTQLLAMLGAEVIKIEPPSGDPARIFEPIYVTMNRGKKSLFLNLKSEEDRKKFFELVKDTDVIVEGYRPGVAKRLGIDYESVCKVNPSIIYCSISAFGQKSKLRTLPAHDINILALAGILEVSGFGKPREPNVQLADFSSSMFATVLILAALIERNKSGKGRYIDISMFRSAIFAIPLHSTPLINGMDILQSFSSNPAYGIYRTSDGYITLGIIAEEHFWRRLCEALELDDKISLLESFEKYEDLKNLIQKKLENMTTQKALDVLLKADVPVAEVKSLKNVEEIGEIVGEKLVEEVEFHGRKYKLIRPPFDAPTLTPPGD